MQHIAVLQRFEKVRPPIVPGFEWENTRSGGGGTFVGSSYRFRVSETASPLTSEQIDELRRWAEGLVARGADGDLAVFARTIGPLADEATRLREPSRATGARRVSPADLDDMRHRAEAVVQNGEPRETRAAARAVLLLLDDVDGARSAQAVARAHARNEGRRRLLVVAGALAVLVTGLIMVLVDRAASLDARGPTQALIGGDGLAQLEFAVPGSADRRDDVRFFVDGRDASASAKVVGGDIVLRPRRLPDGKHTVVVTGEGSLSGAKAWTFTVDTDAPAISVTKGSLAARRGAAYELRGTVGADSTLRVNGTRVDVSETGQFVVPFAAAPRRAVILLARDAAGNATDSRLVVGTAPRLPRNPVRAVHVSADAWAHDGLRSDVLALLDEGRINAVELDLKDESGIIGWQSGLPLARRIGAERSLFDLDAAVSLLHARGARVIGRVVAFRDPVLAKWAWTHGRKELVVQSPDGGAYSGGYGGFTNYANADVQEYNVALAEAAARAGVDDVLYDYVRRPDGPVSSMVVPGLIGDPSLAVTAFLAKARQRLAKHGTFLGASVFGIAATRPDEIAQSVPAIAREVDYIAPMVYPSHWGPQEYGVANPNAQPYAIVRRSLADFARAVRGSGARLVPWLQDFSLGVTYGREEVRAQIRAARDAGIEEFLLWDPTVTYTAAALERSASKPTVGTRRFAPGSSTLVALRPSLSPDAPVSSGLRPNELGSVPVLMYHQLLEDGGGEYDLTPAEFRAELDRLRRAHYRPVTASAFVSGRMNVARGTTPVVMTFDDSTTNQASLLEDGSIDPDSAVGIMLDYAREHPEFRPAGTLYVNRAPFGGSPKAGELARRLVALGFELGNHTYSHARLDQLDDAGVQSEIVRGNRIIRELLPGASVTTIALPYGILPVRRDLALEGAWDGERYRFGAAFLTGAEPAPSPFGSAFDPQSVPRIRTDPGELLNGSSDWLRRLEAEPDARFVSDGNPRRVTYPVELAGLLADAYRTRGNPR